MNVTQFDYERVFGLVCAGRKKFLKSPLRHIVIIL